MYSFWQRTLILKVNVGFVSDDWCVMQPERTYVQWISRICQEGMRAAGQPCLISLL